MKVRRYLSFVFLIIACLFPASVFAQRCPDVVSEHEPVVASIRALFDATAKADYSAFHSVTTPSFYIFDGGRRFDGVAVVDYMKTTFHDKGFRFVWNVTQPSVHTACDTAWITYTNVGSVTEPSGKVTPMQWLESAFLQKEGERWSIQFLQSTRVPSLPRVAR